MSASPSSVDISRLNTRVHSEYDYTNHDAVIDTLITIITCPIVQEVSSEMPIFNEQCYDVISFKHYVDNEKKEES